MCARDWDVMDVREGKGKGKEDFSSFCQPIGSGICRKA